LLPPSDTLVRRTQPVARSQAGDDQRTTQYSSVSRSRKWRYEEFPPKFEDTALELPDESRSRIIGRIAGVDHGVRRIGLAITDELQTLASPADTIAGVGSPRRDADAVFRWGQAHEVAGYVVGLPLNMDGTLGPQAAIVQKFIAALRAIAGSAPVVEWDERLSTFQADEWLASRGTGKRRADPRRDALAAAAILAAYLDANRAR
jgi:putative Holliday junction resolvase